MLTVISDQPFNLIRSAWLPARRQSGCVDWIAPPEIVGKIADDPIVGIAWGRPDFDAAAQEFLIGLLATAMAPEDTVDWRDLWREPPSIDALTAAFASLASNFDLDGRGNRFLQDQDNLADAKEKAIAGLLIDSPGEKTIEDNTDHFVKRGRATVLGRAAAAISLFTLQAYAPSGGVGHRVSLRGGGPLTTLVEDTTKPTLWHRLWLAVESRSDIASRNAAGNLPQQPENVFPWTAPTRTSDPKARSSETTQTDVHGLQVYWGMPRRIRLLFEPSLGRICALTGQKDAVVVVAYRAKNYGVNYTAGFRHPLTPYYRAKGGQSWLPLHGQPTGVGYRHWLGLVVNSEDDMRVPASACTTALNRLSSADRLRLLVCGYDMDNMKPRGFVASALPIILGNDRTARDRIRVLAVALISGTAQVARLLLGTSRAALFEQPSEAKGDISFLAERLWRETEVAFYSALGQLAALNADMPNADHPIRIDWRAVLERHALSLFDEVAAVDAIATGDMARIAVARRNLAAGLRGYGKGGQALFAALGLVAPQVQAKRHKADGKNAEVRPT